MSFATKKTGWKPAENWGNKINYKARVTKNEMEVEPNSEEDYLKLNVYLRRKNVEFNTFALKFEKSLQVAYHRKLMKKKKTKSKKI